MISPEQRRLDVLTHEAAHAVAGHMLGLPLRHVAVGHLARGDSLGETSFAVPEGDPRTLQQVCADAAVASLAPIYVAPGHGGQSDADVRRVGELARLCGADEDAFEAAAGRRAREIVTTGTFLRALDALSAALLERPLLPGADAEELLRSLP